MKPPDRVARPSARKGDAARPPALHERAGQWGRFGRDVDQVELIGLLRQAAARVFAAPDEVLAQHGLNHGEFDVLAALYRAEDGAALTQGELAAAMLVTSAGMKKRLVRLLEAGHVVSTPDPYDARKRMLRLSPAGRRLLESLLDPFFAAESAAFEGLGDSDKRRLARLLRRIVANGEEV